MLLHADWVLPIASPPIREGAVVTKGHHIAEVGTREELVRANPTEPITRHDGCVMLPGLVNGHTHLALTALHEILPSAPFHEWVPLLVRAMRALTDDDLAISSVLGAHRAIASGTTLVGEIAYGPESPAIAADTGLGGTFFWEVLGIAADDLDKQLKSLEYPSDLERYESARQRHGLTAHSPYTSGPGLLAAVHGHAIGHNTGFAIHVAESPAEVELLRDGTGPLADIATRTATGFTAPGVSPVRYLADLGVLDRALAVHCAEILPTDAPLLASHAAGAVLCPRSNAFLHVGPAPVDSLVRSGVTLALGTDSLASNHDFDLFAEARALRQRSSLLSSERIIKMMTAEGARALGLDDTFGTLAAGKQADLALFQVDGGSDPYTALVDQGGRSTVVAVMTAGLWRVLNGQATFPSRFAESAVRHAAVRAAIAIQ